MGDEQTAQQELDELRATFDLHWDAEQRGIKLWQEATGRDLTWPDTAHFTVWLIDRLERAEAVIEVARQLCKVKIDVKDRELGEFEARALDIALHIAAYEKENSDKHSVMNG